MYLVQASLEGRVTSNVSASEIEAATLRFHLLSDIFIVLSWTTVIAVKYSFLSFFRMLIRRVHGKQAYWRYFDKRACRFCSVYDIDRSMADCLRSDLH